MATFWATFGKLGYFCLNVCSNCVSRIEPLLLDVSSHVTILANQTVLYQHSMSTLGMIKFAYGIWSRRTRRRRSSKNLH